MKINFRYILIIILLASLFWGNFSQASFLGGLQNTAAKVPMYGQPVAPSIIAASIIKALLAFIGVVFMILFIYGGFLYMTSAGESDKVKKAKGLIKNAIIGVLIVMSAYAITYFIATQIELSLKG
jgi:predicted permease